MATTKSSSTTAVIVEEESEDVNVPPSRAFHTKSLLSDSNQEEISNHDENSTSSYCMPIDHDSPLRKGTLISATINLLTSMVGGGSLSLPFAFAKAGNILLGPIILLVCASSASYTLRILMDASARVSHNQQPRTLNTSYEIVCQSALGGGFQYITMCMIISVCFVGTLGYAVLIRDLCVPLAHWIHPPSSSSEQPTPLENILMFAIVAAVTPLCTFPTLTSLQNFGMLSIISVSILGSCIVYRSVQCIAASTSTTNDLFSTPPYIHPNASTVPFLSFLPASFQDFLQAFPLVLNCFFCQFNAIPVHAELANPTPRRVSYISKAVVVFASFFYLSIGIFGSIFGSKCTPTGIVSGNILLDFDDDDPVVTLGRLCLGITIAFAFPCQVIPARDTLLRLIRVIQVKKRTKNAEQTNVSSLDDRNDLLLEPLLDGDSLDQCSLTSTSNDMNNYSTTVYPSKKLRVGVAIAIFWSAAAIASRVSSVAVIWDLLGSSLVVLVGFLIPCAICVRILCNEENWNWRKISAMGMIGLYLPLMILCTGNAIRINIVSS